MSQFGLLIKKNIAINNIAKNKLTKDISKENSIHQITIPSILPRQ